MTGYSGNYTSYTSNEYEYSGSMTSDYSSGGSIGGGFIKSEEGSSNFKGSQENDHRNNNLRPVTIKQLHKAISSDNDSSMVIDGLELRVVKIVGVVKSKTPRPKGVDYLVDDGTGLIDIKVWHDDSDETNVNKKIDIAINTYGKFFGHYRVFNSKKHLAAHIVQPIEDHNEISYHMAEVIYAHLYLTKAPNNSSVNPSSSSSSAYESQSRSSGNQLNQVFPSQLHKDIFNLVSRQNNTPMGAEVNEIAQNLAFQYGSDQAVRFAIEDMIGQLYITSDDNHVKTTGKT